MKITYNILFFFLLLVQLTQAQNNTITGVIVDSLQMPISDASISLTSKDLGSANSLANGTVSSFTGDFKLKDISIGNYIIEINHINYLPYFLDLSINTNEQKDLDTIILANQINALNEITINSKRLPIQQTADKITINIESNALGAGGTAIDVLKQLPIVTISSEGEISIRGKSDIQILMDGKPSGFAAVQGQSYLDQLDLSTIERIEVITNPSAILSSNGAGGVINIVKQKNAKNGFNGRFNSGIGSDQWFHFSSGLNYRVSSINIFLDYRIRNRKRIATSYNFSKRNLAQENLYVEENKNGIRDDKRHNAEFGMDYYLNDKQYVTLGLNYSYRDKKDAQNKHTTVSNDIENLETRIGEIGEPETNNNWGVYVNYSEEKSKNTSSTLILDYVHSVEDEDIFREENVTAKSDVYIDGIKSHYIDINDSYLIDLEKKTILKNESKISFGAQAAYRKIKQNFNASKFDNVDSMYTDIHESIDVFNYQDLVSAIYFQNEHIINKFSYEIAVKLELLNNKYNSETQNVSFKDSYFKVFPSFKTTYEFSENFNGVLSFKNGINRPSPNRLNPFPDVSNAFSVSVGNPELKPEIFYNTEFGIQTNINKIDLNTGLYFTVYTDLIQRVSELGSDGFIYTIPINLNKMYHFGADFNLQIEITKWWNQQFGSLLYNRVYEDNSIEASEKTSYQYKTTSNFDITDAIDVQILASYNAPENTPQGITEALYFVDAAIEYSFFKDNKGKMSLVVSDVLNTFKEISTLTTIDLHSEGWQKNNSRRVYITFNYKL